MVVKKTTQICIKNVHKTYGNKSVLRGLDLDIIEGETLVILGRSGAGKSVLLRLIMGLEDFDQGSITITPMSKNQAGNEKARDLTPIKGMLFQSGALFDSMTVAENIEFALKSPLALRHLGKLSQASMQHIIEESLESVGLSGQEEVMPSSLSGGMKKRAGLARLIAIKPKIMLYDEPTTGLDPITAMQINELIVKLQKELDATSIVVTHDLESALTIGDRFALHDAGQIIYTDEKLRFINSQHPTVGAFLASRKKINEHYFINTDENKE